MMNTPVRPNSPDTRLQPGTGIAAPRGDREGSADAKRLLMLALLACVVAATFGAKPLAAWVDASLVSGTFVQDAVDEWSDVMQRIGVTRPYDVLRRAIRDAEAARFPGRD
jgi:hypothetical protein